MASNYILFMKEMPILKPQWDTMDIQEHKWT